MYSPRTIVWINDARAGAENLGEEGDPRQTCIAMNAGDFKGDEDARRLGILQYLFGGGGEGQARTQDAPDAEALSQQASGASKEVLQAAHEGHYYPHKPSVEARAYVENAAGSGTILTEAERQLAGEMGGTFTGPTLSEQSQAGGDYQAASARAQQQMGPGQVETPASQAQRTGQIQPAGEEPKPPDTPPQGRSVPRKD